MKMVGQLIRLLLLLPADAAVQVTKAVYKRAYSLASRTEQKIFRTSLEAISPLGTNRFWYRRQTEADQFDFVLMTGVGHGSAEMPSEIRRRMDFLVRHLYGVVPRAK